MVRTTCDKPTGGIDAFARASRACQERFNRLQVQCTSALREKSDMQNRLNQMMDSAAASGGDAEVIADLQAQVADLRAALDEAHANGGGGGNVDGLMNELQGLQEHNAQLAAELDAARADAQQRVERSQQFINMRQVRSTALPTTTHLCVRGACVWCKTRRG